MRQGRQETVRARLAGADVTGDLAESLREQGVDVTVDDVPHVGPRMALHLVDRGEKFEVEFVGTSETRFILPGEPTEWEWDVTPMNAGNHILKLTVSIVLTVDGADGRSQDVDIKEVPVAVRVDPIYTFTRIGASLWPQYVVPPGGILAVVGAVAAWTRRQRSANKPKAQTSQ